MKKKQTIDKVLIVTSTIKPKATGQLLSDIRLMIEQSRHRFSQAINAEIALLYWNIGKRIRVDILKEKRADYGQRIVSALSIKLSKEYGTGFAEKNLRRMIQLAEVYPDEKIVVSLIRQLSWTHFLAIIPLKDPLQRDFYSEQVELLQLEKSGIRVAEYFTELPPRELLEKKLHEAIRIAREQIAARQIEKKRGK
ncbi:MAG: hypothetical protein A2Z47_16290 [Thermodesulfovibrio sp. RBG_19FT_COMBO_42_12]|nr:MAG: hypothetical protein A2Z47_16290 [Thermodesulfovibrio sp. RBG_19FT_COMBO_42_12]